jgi:hypothetical protein
MVRATPTEVEPYLAVTFGSDCFPTGLVWTENVAAEDPGAIATVEGTMAVERLLVSPTVNPLDGALPRITTVPVQEAPPTTGSGFRVTL